MPENSGSRTRGGRQDGSLIFNLLVRVIHIANSAADGLKLGLDQVPGDPIEAASSTCPSPEVGSQVAWVVGTRSIAGPGRYRRSFHGFELRQA